MITELIEYPKIQNIFARHEITKKIIRDEYKMPEFLYLENTQWSFTEKMDGMNIRVHYEPDGNVTIYGRGSNSEIPCDLSHHIKEVFSDNAHTMGVHYGHGAVFFGEGYGGSIQKGHSKRGYPEKKSFILFDVLICGSFVERRDLLAIGNKLDIPVVPEIGVGELLDCHKYLCTVKRRNGEGLVAKPAIRLYDSRRNRIIAKIKASDFSNDEDKLNKEK